MGDNKSRSESELNDDCKIVFPFKSIRNVDVLNWVLDDSTLREFELTYVKKSHNYSKSCLEQVKDAHLPISCKKETSRYDMSVRPKELGSRRVVGNRIPSMNQRVLGIQDSTHLLVKKDWLAIHNILVRTGYVYFKRVLPREAVLRSRDRLLDSLKDLGHTKENDRAVSQTGWTIETGSGTTITGSEDFAEDKNITEAIMDKWKNISKRACLKDLVDHDIIKSVLRNICEVKSKVEGISWKTRTFDPLFTWLRIKAPNEFTVEHSDIFYFKKFTELFGPSRSSMLNTNSRTCVACGGDSEHSKVIKCAECEVYCLHTHDDCISTVSPTTLREPASGQFPAQRQRLEKGNCKGKKRKLPSDGSEELRSRQKPSQQSELSDSAQAERGTYFCGGFDRTDWCCPYCQPRPLLGTCWIPLGDIPVEQGVLALLPGSTALPNYMRTTAGQQLSASYPKSALGLNWHTGPFEAGDFVLFDSRLVHCTSKNHTDSFRISLDFRWYLAPEGRDNFLNSHQGKFVLQNCREY